MNIIINISEPIKKVQEFQEYDLGQITTTLQDLLDNSSITINSNIIPILKVLSIDNISKSYLIKDLSENLYNTSDYITGQDLTENDLILIEGGNQSSVTEIDTSFTDVTYNAVLSVPYNAEQPNFEVTLTGNLDLTITGTVNGDSGLVNLYFTGTELVTLNGFTDLIVTGIGVMVPVYFIHDGDGLKWYNTTKPYSSITETSTIDIVKNILLRGSLTVDFSTDAERVIGMSTGFVEGKTGIFRFGDVNNQIENEYGQPVIYRSYHGHDFRNRTSSVCRLGKTDTSLNSAFFGSVQVSNDVEAASSGNVGAIRYRTDANNSYCEQVMQTGAATYAWVIIKQNTW